MLLLYSGGLDTSVMLKWIQDSYEAEVVCLTVNLGQPGEDYEVIEGKALQLGALECHVVDAREEFAREYPAAGDQGQRDLRRRLPAVHRARAPADRQARGRAGTRERLRHDRARLHRQGQRPGAHRGDDRDARTRAEGDRAGALVADGARGGDRLRARARHPDQGAGRRGRRAVLDRRQPLGTLLGGPLDRGSRARPRRRRLPARHAARSARPTTRRRSSWASSAACPSRSTASASSWSTLIERVAEIGARHGVGIVDHIEDRIVGLKVRDIYEVPAAAIVLLAHQELEQLVGTIHQNQFKPELDRQWAYPRLRGPVVGAAARGPRRLHGARQRAGHRHDRPEALQGPRPRRRRAPRRTPCTTRASPPSRSPAASSRRPPRRGSSSCCRCSRAWRGACVTAERLVGFRPVRQTVDFEPRRLSLRRGPYTPGPADPRAQERP